MRARGGRELAAGCYVRHRVSGAEGAIEYLSDNRADVLVDFADSDDAATHEYDEFAFSRDDKEGKSTLRWCLSSDLEINARLATFDKSGRKGLLTKRQVVQDYEDRLR